MSEVLVADDIRRSYGDTVAVDGVSLSVSTGEIFGLIGPNGAGKTTLIRALTGTTDAEGTVTVFGESPKSVQSDRIGLLPQSFTPPERLTARELIAYYGGLYDAPEETESILDSVGLAESADTWYEKLSGGQKRRACVGIALVNKPDLLFLDEPTTGIDPVGRRALWRLLEELAANGTTIFLTSHSMDEVEQLADRVGLLQNGSLVAVGEPDTLIQEHGGTSRLVIEVAEKALESAVSVLTESGYTVESGVSEVVIHNVSPIDISAVIKTIDTADIQYDSLTWTEPTLEDVYLQLTGETFEGTFTPGASVVKEQAAEETEVTQ